MLRTAGERAPHLLETSRETSLASRPLFLQGARPETQLT
jgi:hypothetical protein